MMRSPLRPFVRTYNWESFLFLFLVVSVVTATLVSPLYLSAFQILYSLQQSMAITAIMAIGFMMIIVVGEIDISLPALVAMGTVSFARLSLAGMPFWLSVVIVFGFSILAGLFNGFLVVTFSLPSMAVTLGMSAVYRAIALWIGGKEGYGLSAFKPAYIWLGDSTIGKVPISLLLIALLFVIAYLLVHKTAYGRLLYATGNNRKATRLSGHNVKRIIASTYGIAGLTAGIAALVFVGQYQSARADNLNSILLFVVACVALGGFRIEGGKGNVVGLILSILLLGTIQNAMGLQNVNGSVQMFVVGLVLMVSILISTLADKASHLRSGTKALAARTKSASAK